MTHYYIIEEADSIKDLVKKVGWFLGNSTYIPLGGPFVFGQFNQHFGQALVSSRLEGMVKKDGTETDTMS